MKMKSLLFHLVVLVVSISCSSAPSLQSTKHLDTALGKWSQGPNCCTASGEKYAAVTGGKNASRIAIEILKSGGNAIDAAVAAAFAICVERPQSTGIGGGGFMTVRWNGKNHFVDFRESAPQKATKDMFLDEKGELRPGASQHGGLAVAVPGMVAGLWDIHKKWGKLKWKEVLQPAIALAGKEGLELLPTLADRIGSLKAEILKDPYLASILLTPTGEVPAVGSKFFQKDLAATLTRIANEGPSAFYKGAVAKKMVDEINRTGGVFQMKDLEDYRVKYRVPVVVNYAGYTVVTAPPPSAGGIMIGQMLGMLEGENISAATSEPTAYVHLLAEAMRRGFADRSVYAGDPDMVKVPVKGLLSPKYIAKVASTIHRDKATPSAEIRPLQFFANDAGTSGLAIVDDKGDAVSATITVNTAFGALLAVPGTGILLNNEMDDFSAKPGAANSYGLTGNDANSIAPMKRPVSSMTPTVLLKDGKAVAAFTGAGGSRIISGVFQALLHYTTVKPGDMHAAIFSPRMHHQWVPDQLDLEEGWGDALKGKLESMGHKVTMPSWQPNILGVGRAPDGKWIAVYDPRDIGGVAAE